MRNLAPCLWPFFAFSCYANNDSKMWSDCWGQDHATVTGTRSVPYKLLNILKHVVELKRRAKRQSRRKQGWSGTRPSCPVLPTGEQGTRIKDERDGQAPTLPPDEQNRRTGARTTRPTKVAGAGDSGHPVQQHSYKLRYTRQLPGPTMGS